MASRLSQPPAQCPHDTGLRHLLPRAEGARCALRRPLFRRRVLDAHLLPPGVHRAPAEARELPLLSQRRGRRVGWLPALPALPARTRAGQRQRGRDLARGAGRGEPDRGPRARRRRAGGRRFAPGHHRPASAPRVRRRIRRLAGGVRANPATSTCQAPAHRYLPAGHRDRVRQRLWQPAALQRAVQAALSLAARSVAPAHARRGGARDRHP